MGVVHLGVDGSAAGTTSSATSALSLWPLGLKAWGPTMTAADALLVDGLSIQRHSLTLSWYLPSDLRFVRLGGEALLLTSNGLQGGSGVNGTAAGGGGGGGGDGAEAGWPLLRVNQLQDSQINTSVSAGGEGGGRVDTYVSVWGG